MRPEYAAEYHAWQKCELRYSSHNEEADNDPTRRPDALALMRQSGWTRQNLATDEEPSHRSSRGWVAATNKLTRPVTARARTEPQLRSPAK